jgi:hypothetical protein
MVIDTSPDASIWDRQRFDGPDAARMTLDALSGDSLVAHTIAIVGGAH